MEQSTKRMELLTYTEGPVPDDYFIRSFKCQIWETRDELIPIFNLTYNLRIL